MMKNVSVSALLFRTLRDSNTLELHILFIEMQLIHMLYGVAALNYEKIGYDPECPYITANSKFSYVNYAAEQ